MYIVKITVNQRCRLVSADFVICPQKQLRIEK